jgi:hypothetical protein
MNDLGCDRRKAGWLSLFFSHDVAFEYFGEIDAELVLDHDDFAPGYQLFIGINLDLVADPSIQLHDGAAPHFQELADFHVGGAEDGHELDGYAEARFDIVVVF